MNVFKISDLKDKNAESEDIVMMEDSAGGLNKTSVAQIADYTNTSGTVEFESDDVADGQADKWTTVQPLASGETHPSFAKKVSQMFKNVRYLFKMMGSTDFASAGDATVTGALAALAKNKLNTSDVVNNLVSTQTGKALDATQGKALQDAITELNTLSAKIKAIRQESARLKPEVCHEERKLRRQSGYARFASYITQPYKQGEKSIFGGGENCHE